MPTIDEIRAQYPQYGDMSDKQLSDALYSKFYSDMPRDKFDETIGVKPKETFGESLQRSWDKPHPHGLMRIVKDTLGSMEYAVQASKDVMSEPRTEEEAFIQNQARDLGPIAAMKAGAILGPTAPRGTGGIFAAPMRAPVNPVAAIQPSQTNPTLEAAAEIGVNIPKYLATDSMAVQRTAAGVKNIPFSGDKIIKSAQAVNEGLGTAAKNTESALGVGSVDVAGGAAKDSLRTWIKKESASALDDSYKNVNAMVNPDIKGELAITAKELSKIISERANARIMGNSKAGEIVFPAIQAGGLNYEGAKMLRSFLGESTPRDLIAQGIVPSEAKRLYGAMTKDLEDITYKAGGDAALGAWKEANALAAATAEQRRQLYKIIGAKADASPESVFARLASYAGSKSSADINRLALAKSAMGKDAWNEVASAVVSKLGRDPQGNFSPDRFVTAYGNLSGNGKSLLFENKDIARTLDNINAVSAAIKDKITKFSNPSGTAQNLIGGGMVAGILAEPLTMISSVLGGRIMSEVLSRPATAKSTLNYLNQVNMAMTLPAHRQSMIVELATKAFISDVSKHIKDVDVASFLRAMQGTKPIAADDQKKQ